jgi:16S rRNA (cytosine1402-N4)-methyltransferase
MERFHAPVMLGEVVASLDCRPGGVYIDGTLGGGGHAEAILERTAPDGFLIGIDQDEEALAAARRRLAPYRERTLLIHGNFARLEALLADRRPGPVDGILLDLGVSSHQLDTASRGFSFSLPAPLDMRMDRSRGITARELLSSASAGELERIIREYGEEIMAARIVRAITAERRRTPIETTADLARIVTAAVPPPLRHGRIHPATRTFQALRIAVNDELTRLREALPQCRDRLRPGGRLSVIAFHSLEDRIVKETFRAWEKGCICPPGLPVCACGLKPSAKPLHRKPQIPGSGEIARNPRARSARLRTVERTGP